MIWFIDGMYASPENAGYNLNNSGFLHGYGVFTTLLYSNSCRIPFYYHLERLRNACKKFNLLFPEIDYRMIMRKLLEYNKVNLLRIRIILQKSEDRTTKVIVTADNFSPQKKRFKLVSCSEPRHCSVLNKYKTTNYMLPMYYKQVAMENGFDEMLFHDCEGNVLETCFANVFFVRNRHIYTPPVTNEILAGTARRTILEKGEIEGFQVTEANISMKEIGDFESVFLTNAVHGVMQVDSIDNIKYTPISFTVKL